MKIAILVIALVLVSAHATCPFHQVMQGLQSLSDTANSFLGFEEQQQVLTAPPVTSNASQTVDAWFEEVRKTKYAKNPSFAGADLNSIVNVAKFTVESMTPTMEDTNDFIQKGRKKYIHPRGSVAKIKFVPTTYSTQTYDGLFKGADFGLIRFSLAGDPESLGFTPGLAMKFFRNNNVVSGNVIAMYSLDGQGDNYNFFQNEFSNWINETKQLKLKFLENVVFKRASSCPLFLSLYDFGQYDQNGNYFGYSPKVPRRIYFSPVTTTQFSTNKFVKPGVVKDFRDDLATLPKGTQLYNVYDDQSKIIGKIYTESEFVSSSFGDDVLFFKHRKGDDMGC